MNVNLSKLHRLSPEVRVSGEDFHGVVGCTDCPIYNHSCPLPTYDKVWRKIKKGETYRTYCPCPIDRLDERTFIGYKLIKKIPNQRIRDYIFDKLMRFYNKIRER